MELAMGVDLGGTNIKGAVVSSRGDVLSFFSNPTEVEKGKERVFDNLEANVRSACQRAGVKLSEIKCVGIGSPGPLNTKTGIVIEAPNLPGWNYVPLKDIFEERLGVPVFIENDANAAGYAEAWLGAGRGTDCMLLFTLGTGIGGAIVINGELWHGPDDSAAELGHITIKYDGALCGCGNKGCLEAYASAPATVKRMKRALARGKKSTITRYLKEGRELTTKLIHKVAREGDELCRRVIKETGTYLGIAFSSYINIFNPDIIVLHGGLSGAGRMLFDAIRAEIKKRSFSMPAKRVRIVRSRLKGRAGVIGSAGCAFKAYGISV